MTKGVVSQRKLDFRTKLEKFLDDYKHILICNIDNVGSHQLQQIRISLRGKAVIMCGKNTIIRKVMKDVAKKNENLNKLIPEIFGNVAMVFANGELADIRKIIVGNKNPAAARVGTLAPDDCWVQPGPTGLDPGQTNFFQALNISTKIVRGSIEIMNPVHLIKKGDKVTPSHVSLLSKLDIKPFYYFMTVTHVYEDGALYAAEILDITKDSLAAKFLNGVSKITALALAIGVPTLSTIPHSFARAFKNLLALAVENDDIEFKQAVPYKEFVKDPASWAAKHGVPVGPKDAPDKKDTPAAKVDDPKKESESDGGDLFGGGGLFGDD